MFLSTQLANFFLPYSVSPLPLPLLLLLTTSSRLVGAPYPHSRLPVPQDIPTLFHDKTTVAVTLHDVFVEGIGGVIYNACEVFATQGFNTDVNTTVYSTN